VSPESTATLIYSLISLILTWFVLFSLLPALRLEAFVHRIRIMKESAGGLARESPPSFRPEALPAVLHLLDCAARGAGSLTFTAVLLHRRGHGPLHRTAVTDPGLQRWIAELRLEIARFLILDSPLLWWRLPIAVTGGRWSDPDRLLPPRWTDAALDILLEISPPARTSCPTARSG
jgi:hypothetical protein